MDKLNGNTTIKLEYGNYVLALRPVGFVFKGWFFGYVELRTRAAELPLERDTDTGQACVHDWIECHNVAVPYICSKCGEESPDQ